MGLYITFSLNFLCYPVLTWNLPISALNLSSEEFITCKGIRRKISVIHSPNFPVPMGGIVRVHSGFSRIHSTLPRRFSHLVNPEVSTKPSATLSRLHSCHPGCFPCVCVPKNMSSSRESPPCSPWPCAGHIGAT